MALQTFNIHHKGWEDGDILGLTFSRNGIRQGTRFQETTLALIKKCTTEESISNLKLLQLGGRLLWASLTTARLPLSGFPYTLKAIQKAASGSDITVSEELKLEWMMWSNLLQKNSFFVFPSSEISPQRLSILWTDASLSRSAWVHHENTKITWWSEGTDNPHALPIFYWELAAAYIAVQKNKSTYKNTILLTDNAALAAALSKGHSSKGGIHTNNLIYQILRNIVAVGWVPTHIQTADALTRDPITQPQLHLCRKSIPMYSSFYLLGGRGGGDHQSLLSIHNTLQQQSTWICDLNCETD